MFYSRFLVVGLWSFAVACDDQRPTSIDPTMKIVTAAEMREIDRATSQRFGVPSLTLMENAGSAVAEFVVAQYPSAERIGVICGKGNNGGDGFVAARKLKAAGKEVRVVLLAEPAELRGDAAEMFARLPVAPVIVRYGEELKREQARAVFESEVLLDAILGTGFKPPVSGLYAEAIRLLNASPAHGGCGRYSFRRRCRCDGRTDRRGGACRRCGYIYRAASGAHFRKIDRRADTHCSDRLAGRSHRFFVATQSDYCPRDCAPHWPAAARSEQGKLRPCAGDWRLRGQGRLSRHGGDGGAANRSGIIDGGYAEVRARHSGGISSRSHD